MSTALTTTGLRMRSMGLLLSPIDTRLHQDRLPLVPASPLASLARRSGARWAASLEDLVY